MAEPHSKCRTSIQHTVYTPFDSFAYQAKMKLLETTSAKLLAVFLVVALGSCHILIRLRTFLRARMCRAYCMSSNDDSAISAPATF